MRSAFCPHPTLPPPAGGGARARATRPAVGRADEPTGALDPRTAQQVLDLIRQLCAEVNAALLMVTHDRAIAAQLARTVHLADINLATAPQMATD